LQGAATLPLYFSANISILRNQYHLSHLYQSIHVCQIVYWSICYIIFIWFYCDHCIVSVKRECVCVTIQIKSSSVLTW